METPTVACWHIGLSDHCGREDGVVAFTSDEIGKAAPRAAVAVGLHEAMTGSMSRAPRVEIHLPSYRPRSFIPVLSWLASQLGQDGAEVSWHLDKRQGPDSVRKLLGGLGWTLGKERRGQQVRLNGVVPGGLILPEPAGFVAELGTRRATVAADYGVFSPDHIDEGTSLLLEVALAHPPVDVVADIGIGYGSLAIGLVLNSVARAALGTDVDCVALWLAERNARVNAVPLALTCDPDPSAVPSTPLTICNIPTHINAEQTTRLMAALTERARHGTLLTVVHGSLEERYRRHLAAANLHVTRHPGAAHVVLEATRSER